MNQRLRRRRRRMTKAPQAPNLPLGRARRASHLRGEDERNNYAAGRAAARDVLASPRAERRDLVAYAARFNGHAIRALPLSYRHCAPGTIFPGYPFLAARRGTDARSNFVMIKSASARFTPGLRGLLGGLMGCPPASPDSYVSSLPHAAPSLPLPADPPFFLPPRFVSLIAPEEINAPVCVLLLFNLHAPRCERPSCFSHPPHLRLLLRSFN